jgi:hypothetical protein
MLTFLEIDGLIMVDSNKYYTEFPSDKPILMDVSDCRKWISDCTCTVCKEHKGREAKKLQSPFESYNHITLERWHDLKLHQYLLCPKDIRAFVFRTRNWGKTPSQ